MRHLQLPPFENVGAGQIAIIPRIPMGETYHGIVLNLGGTTFTKALISRILIRLGGKVIVDVTGSQMDTLNKYQGMTASAAFLLIPFSEFTAKTVVGETMGAIDTSLPYSGFSMEVTIAAGAVAPTLTAQGLTTPGKVVQSASHRPLFRALIPSTHNIGAAGTYNLPLPLGSSAGALIKRLHLFHANVTGITAKMNGLDLMDNLTTAQMQFWQNNLTRVTQPGHLCIDPIVRDNQSETIPTVNGNGREHNFEWRTTLSAGDTISAISELYAPISSI